MTRNDPKSILSQMIQSLKYVDKGDAGDDVADDQDKSFHDSMS